MSNRKNIKIDESMYERLRNEKKKYETWNAVFDRLLNQTED
jgi:predicted CopG family antitoxin